jgi:hypothetical protein
MGHQTKLQFQLRCANHRWFNTTMIRRRYFDGQIVSMQQAGTHWLRHMLSLCMAEVYGKQPPETIQSMDFIGRPKQRPKYNDIPQLSSSHSLPHGLMYYFNPVAHRVKFPKYIILVRDMRHALVSGYEKWKERYQVDFSTFLVSSPLKEGYFNDIWRQIEFLNSWGRLADTGAYDTLVLRYEDMKADTPGSLQKACTHFGIAAPQEVMERAVEASSKANMASLSKARNNEHVIRMDKRHPFEWFTAKDRQIFQDICQAHLTHPCGYDYTKWDA